MTDIEIRVLASYEATNSLKSTAKLTGISEQTARKILITHGKYASVTSIRVAELLVTGKSVEEIAQELHLSRSAVGSYMPYTKGTYYSPPSKNALRIRRYRNNNS